MDRQREDAMRRLAEEKEQRELARRKDRQRVDAMRRLDEEKEQRELARRKLVAQISADPHETLSRLIESLRQERLAQSLQRLEQEQIEEAEAVLREQAETSRLTALAALELTVASLDSFLREHDFEVRNNRSNGGGLFVKHDPRFDSIASELKRRGVEVRQLFWASWPGLWMIIDRDQLLN